MAPTPLPAKCLDLGRYSLAAQRSSAEVSVAMQLILGNDRKHHRSGALKLHAVETNRRERRAGVHLRNLLQRVVNTRGLTRPWGTPNVQRPLQHRAASSRASDDVEAAEIFDLLELLFPTRELRAKVVCSKDPGDAIRDLITRRRCRETR